MIKNKLLSLQLGDSNQHQKNATQVLCGYK